MNKSFRLKSRIYMLFLLAPCFLLGNLCLWLPRTPMDILWSKLCGCTFHVSLLFCIRQVVYFCSNDKNHLQSHNISETPVMLVVISMVGRFLVIIGINTILQMSMEVIPTIIRGQSNSILNAFANLLTLASSYIAHSVSSISACQQHTGMTRS